MQNFVGQVKSIMVFLTVAYLVVLKVADRVVFFLESIPKQSNSNTGS